MRSFITCFTKYSTEIELRIRWTGHVANVGEMRNVYKILVTKPKGNKPLRRLRHRWENNTRMDCREAGWEGVAWIHLAEGRYQ